MARPKAVVPTVRKALWLPSDLVAELELEGFSEVEGRVPYRAISRLVAHLLRAHIDQRRREGRPILEI